MFRKDATCVARQMRSITKIDSLMQRAVNVLDSLQHLLYFPSAAELFCQMNAYVVRLSCSFSVENAAEEIPAPVRQCVHGMQG